MRKLCTFSLEIMLNHLNVICDMSHVMAKHVCVNMSHGRVGSNNPAGACAVFGYHRGREIGFFQDRDHILAYIESYYISVVCKL